MAETEGQRFVREFREGLERAMTEMLPVLSAEMVVAAEQGRIAREDREKGTST